MTDQHQHRATPEQWAWIEDWAEEKTSSPNCILELRDRIAALEAAQASTPPTAPAPAGSLVERVAARVEYGIDAEQEPEGIARAAILGVAAWAMPSVGNNGSADDLEREAANG